ncbi:tRNA/rRNA cytosine-C5-methylase [Giardia muris]|uniref:tRNA/rRNA cytosine-C5-methylase n=1 Tax=Giardia muris TaxID=5742 RepID=A0A4Z1T3H6_GIAMU|nr:tRNA/rRNA cytosine-C5-methylase [Giardia muris]|eukprot:TNJ27109.1 tRNA/rRNA cytosine-C5-methylase [Giardia muris]
MTLDTFVSAARTVHQFMGRRGGLKALAYKQPQPAAVYALALHALEAAPVVGTTLTDLLSLPSESFEHALALVLLGEMLGENGSPHRRRRLNKQTRNMIATLKPLLAQFPRPPRKTQTPMSLPRSLRINRCKNNLVSIDNLVVRLTEELKGGAEVERHGILDEFILLHSPNGTHPAHDIPSVRDGLLVMQSLASGLPVVALCDAVRSLLQIPSTSLTLLDLCAAPGSKTFHACGHFGGVRANDLSDSRTETILKRAHTLIENKEIVIGIEENLFGKLCITTGNALEITGKYDVIVCDPTCSSSGIYRNRDAELAKLAGVGKNKAALEDLCSFQRRIVTHALQAFPSAKLVSYSTCSIHQEENEDIVRSVLEVCGQEWGLFHALPDWKLRGYDMPETIRADRSIGTDGFFVAIFARKSLLVKELQCSL